MVHFYVHSAHELSMFSFSYVNHIDTICIMHNAIQFAYLHRGLWSLAATTTTTPLFRT